MAERSLKCPKCASEMEQVHLGYLVMESSWGPALPIRCVQGKVGKSFWRGRKTVEIEKEYSIDSYRCTRCGYLENYASDELHEKR